jgi:CRP/FNR family transcriptional regulator, cyclic AMP receptor protein
MNAEIQSPTAQHPFLRSLSPEHLAIVLHNAKKAEFATGEIILKEGEPANRFFLIESGRVIIETRQGNHVQTLGPGEVLGWSWLFPPFSWSFSARAVEPTKCVMLDGGHLLVTAEENPGFGYDLMRRISQIVIGRLQATRKKLLKTSESRNL